MIAASRSPMREQRTEHRDPITRSFGHARCRQEGCTLDSIRCGSLGSADGRGRDRRPARDLEAQRAVPARRPSRLFLRVHGCDGIEPLSAGPRLSQGRAAEGGLFRLSHGGLSEGKRSVLGVGVADQFVRHRRYHAEGDRLRAQIGSKAAPDRCRARLPPCRCRRRAVKSPEELRKLRIASERVIESMLAVIANHGPGATKRELTEALRREETNRGLTFDYCLITAGSSLNRAPSEQKWSKGDVLSLDSGGNYHGYIGDLCRMAIHGEPDAELEDLLAEIESIQRASMKPIKAGATGSVIYAAAEPLVHKSKHHNHMHFLAHGMGLVSHEAPRLTATGPVPYDAYDADRPLERGMVVSVETTLQHPQRGFIKLEDTVVVTDTGFEIYGEGGRGWNRGGTALR